MDSGKMARYKEDTRNREKIQNIYKSNRKMRGA